jgi:tetratricopeptide (TPR) repeat protein
LDASWKYLDQAHELAAENRYESFQADSLMQMGEVRRCQGNEEEARELLNEALVRSAQMGLLVTQAFAQSALGAVEYQQERWLEAEATLELAQELFERCDHAEGLALNARRRATVTRQAGVVSDRDNLSVVERLIRSAFQRYTHLRSPAGIAACQIERGRLQMLRCDGQRSVGAVKNLKLLLQNFHQRDLLERDLWVPRVLDAFARETNDDVLAADAERVRLSAEQRLADRVAQGAREHAGTTEEPDPPHDEDHCVLVAEMGSETLRDASSHEHALAA